MPKRRIGRNLDVPEKNIADALQTAVESFHHGSTERRCALSRGLRLRSAHKRSSQAENQGSVIRPGAALAPFWVWQLLQSPVLAVPDITRSTPAPFTTLALYGPGSEVDE